jgi:type I restriction enzyme S subunit
MEVRPGYKQTEVGVIPEDWEVKTFVELFAFRNGVNADKDSYGQGIRFINVLEPITYSHLYGPEITGQVTLPEPVAASYTVRRGDVLFNRTSETQEEVGLAATYLGADRVVFGGFVIRGRPTDQSLDPTYSGYALRAPFIRSQIIAMGQGAIRANIGQQNLSLVIAPVPPLAEQEAIAEALSDADALIEALEQLLEKKRQLKQGAMQELLTGKRRLPGFRGEWEVKQLGDVCQIATGKKDVDEGNPDGQFPFFTCSRSHTYSGSYSFDMEAILIAGNGDVGNLHYYKGKFEAYQRTYVLSAFSTNVSYLWQELSAYLADSLGLGKIGSSIPYIKKENLLSFQFHSPRDEVEQTAIATVLSDMDSDSSALEAKLAKARHLKQGMMQELLTGRIRLI